MSTETPGPRKGPEPPDLSERGGMKAGQPQRSDERLFMQLLVYGGCRDTGPVSPSIRTRPSVSRRLKPDL